MDYPPFPGFRKNAFDFLRDLKENNEREWFNERKSTYEEEVQWPLRCLVADATRVCASREIPLKGDPKKSLFRIYRDTRFSKNKAPYKTHASAVISRSGDKNDPGGVYIHIEPRNCMLAAGYWRPDPKLLRSLRQRMADDPKTFLAIANKLKKKGLPVEPHDEGLKRLPKGFEEVDDERIIPFLKWKSFIVVRNLNQKEVSAPTFTKSVVDFARDVQPFLQYGWAVT